MSKQPPPITGVIGDPGQALRVQQELLRVTLSSIADGVIATDLRSQVTFMNPVAEQLTGWSQAEAAGKPLAEIFRVISDRTGEPVENSVIRAVRQGGSVARVQDKTLIARDGTQRPIGDSAAPIRDERGNFHGFVLVFRDVTERRCMEAELRQRADALAAADRRKDEFLAMLAHELRNPLAPIRNAVQLLRLSGGEGPAALQARDVIDRQVHNLARLVDDLLDVARVSRGKVQLHREKVDLAAVVHRAVETTRPVIDERNHQLVLSLPRPGISLDADPTRLEQVVANLLNNAAKYTDPGGRIWLIAERQGNETVIRVRDTGVGISPDMIGHIFDLFTQADRSLDRAQGGLGIGLTLVRSLVEMHGGRVSVASDGLGKGSEFIVRLPALPEAVASPSTPPASNAPSLPVGQRVRLLIVDDNVDMAATLSVLLNLEGHDVRVAHDGAEALALADAFKPEVVLLDIGLPGMDGYEVARKLRGRPGLALRFLIALTGHGRDEDIQRSLQAGFDRHLVKPIDPPALRKILAEAARQATKE
jgi:two-component system CheB/CheR fusion protein